PVRAAIGRVSACDSQYNLYFKAGKCWRILTG
ncbi:hypothetical protein GCK32_014842, partial [Trichostrongylus colubriformis]